MTWNFCEIVYSSGSVALLCRNCGRDIVKGSALTNEKSSKAIRSYNMTILGRNQLVQVFENAVRMFKTPFQIHI